MENSDIFGFWYLGGNITGIWLGLTVQLSYNLEGGLLIWFAVLAPWLFGILLGYFHCEQRNKKGHLKLARNEGSASLDI